MARRAKNKTGADISSAELLRALLNPNRVGGIEIPTGSAVQ